MSETYSPRPGAEPEPPYTTVFLSQRDLGLRVPLNFVTTPGVSLTAACFAHQKYEDESSGDCLSSLLAVGFRRFEIDLYWDQARNIWSFCPVSIPSSIPNAVPSSTITLSPSSSTNPTPSNAISRGTSGSISARTPFLQSLGARQESTPSKTSGSSLGATLPSVSTVPDTSNEPLVSIGPYVCTSTMNLSTFISQLSDYIQKTESLLGANILYVVMNIHAAASAGSPSSPAPAPSKLPSPSNYLGNLFSTNLSTYLYTQSNLRSERTNLNSSWYTVNELFRPVSEYYAVSLNENGIASTEDGWPSESYVEFSKSKRLLLQWGSVDPQMAGYNFSGDLGTIFPNSYIQDVQNDINVTSSGNLTSGCFLRSNTDNLSVEKLNSSWAVSTRLAGFDYPTGPKDDIGSLLNLTSDLVQCGISPILNATLLNSTAHENYKPYQNFSYSSIWSWAPGEPKNFTANTDSNSDSLFRCATSKIGLNGRWTVTDCSEKYYAACRKGNEPYNWTLTTYPISYSFATSACPDRYDFSVPRTALENSFLTQAMRTARRDLDGSGVWVDFNSLDVKGCWTSGGSNSTCPYSNTLAQQDSLQKRVILVPTIAALIVLIITALTVMVKAAGNRRTQKQVKKRANNGFIYEGVAS